MKTLLTLLLIYAGFANCQTTNTWNGAGSDDNMGTSSNWSAGTPAGDDILIFDGSNRTSPENNLTLTNRHQIVFAPNASSFIINGSTVNTFDFHSPNIPKITNSSAFGQIINFPISISYVRMEFNPTGESLTFGGSIVNNGNDLIVAANTGKTISFLNGISGAGKMIVNQNSNVYLGGVACSYTGNTEVNAGVLLTEVNLSSTNFLISGGKFQTGNSNIINDAADFILSGGELYFGDNETIDNLTIYDGTLHVATGKTLTINGKLKISGTFSTTGGGTIAYGSSSNLEYASGASLTSTSTEWPTISAPLIILSNGTTVNLHAPRSIRGTLNLSNGIIVTSATNLLTFEDGSIISGGNSTAYVSGPVKKIGDNAFTFPTGKGTKWARIRMSAPLNVTDAFIAEYFDFAYSDLSVSSPLSNVSSVEHWDLNRVTGISDVNITLYYESGSYSGISSTPTTSNTIVAHYNIISGNWEDNGGTRSVSGNPSSGTITMSTVDEFSVFTFGSIGGVQPLPVKISSLLAKRMGNTSEVLWTTSSEINNDYFSIERRNSNGDYEIIGNVKGKGNSLTNVNYSFIDQTPDVNTINFYRIVQHDFNGVNESFGPVGVKFATIVNLVSWPNPFSTSISITISEEVIADKITVTNLLGTIIYEESINEHTASVVSLSTETWMPGNYIVIVSGPNFKNVNRHIKL